jgi:hypothetical protein
MPRCSHRLRACTGALLVAAAAAIGGCEYASRRQAPSASPTSLPAAAQSESAQQPSETLRTGLERENYYRALLKIPVVVEDPALSKAAWKHARYVVKNHLQGGMFSISNGRLGVLRPESEARHEIAGNPWYSDDGATAGGMSPYIATGTVMPTKMGPIVDQLLTLPFSAILALDPQLSQVGYGQFCEAGECAAVLSIRHGLDKATFSQLYEGSVTRLWNPANGPLPLTPARLRSPIEFPPPGAAIDVSSYAGNGWPDPLAMCRGYEAPTGPPIILLLGQGSGPKGLVQVGDHDFSDDTERLDHCVLEAAAYAEALEQRRKSNQLAHDKQTEDQESRERQAEEELAAAWYLLHAYGAAVLIPRAPLQSGRSYSVSIIADSRRYEWSFSVTKPQTLAAAGGGRRKK